jgi:hypothetical protein
MPEKTGAGEGKRTLVCSLGSSIELSPLNDLRAKPYHFGVDRIKRLRMERKTLSVASQMPLCANGGRSWAPVEH